MRKPWVHAPTDHYQVYGRIIGKAGLPPIESVWKALIQEEDMALTMRRYDHAVDYERVGQFLERTYRRSGERVNWVHPCSEYVHYHPTFETSS
jgi:hypothetical protein